MVCHIFACGWLVVLLSSTVQAQSADAVTWNSLPEALSTTEAEARPILIYVHAAWCGPCLRMERDVFPSVQPLLDRFARAELDFDDHETALTVGDVTRSPFAWAQHFGAEAPPALILLDTDGNRLTQVTGFVDTDGLAVLLAWVATGAHRHASFEAYAAQVQ